MTTHSLVWVVFTELETVQEKQALILIMEDSSEFLCLKNLKTEVSEFTVNY